MSIAKRRLLLIHPGPLLPIAGGGAQRTWALVDNLQHFGYELHLVTWDHGRKNSELRSRVDKLYIANQHQIRRWRVPFRFVRKVLRIGLRTAFGLVGFRSKKSALRSAASIQERRNAALEEYSGRIAYAIRPAAAISTYAWTARSLDWMPPGTLRLVDTIDVQYVRRFPQASEDSPHQDVDRRAEDERTELQRADVLIAVQEDEREILASLCPNQRVIVVGHSPRLREPVPTPSSEKSVLFIASNYPPNVEGIREFIDTTWPDVLAELPGAELIVCGRVCEALQEIRARNVKMMGYIKNLDAHYQRCPVVVNPVSYGTGIMIKTVEALGRAKCIVCTPEAVRGLNEARPIPAVVADLGRPMAEAIVALLENPDQRATLERDAHSFAMEQLSPEGIYGELLRTLEAIPLSE